MVAWTRFLTHPPLHLFPLLSQLINILPIASGCGCNITHQSCITRISRCHRPYCMLCLFYLVHWSDVIDLTNHSVHRNILRQPQTPVHLRWVNAWHTQKLPARHIMPKQRQRRTIPICCISNTNTEKNKNGCHRSPSFMLLFKQNSCCCRCSFTCLVAALHLVVLHSSEAMWSPRRVYLFGIVIKPQGMSPLSLIAVPINKKSFDFTYGSSTG